MVLKFDYGSRNAYHSHAFYSISWLLSGGLVEFVYGGPDYKVYIPSLIPIWISRKRTHKVYGTYQANWVLSFRGPWKNTWIDIEPTKTNVLTHGRKVINESPD